MSDTTIRSIDAKLASTVSRRNRAIDLCVRSLEEIDTLTTRIEELLLQRSGARP